jgi:hypothetical protein
VAYEAIINAARAPGAFILPPWTRDDFDNNRLVEAGDLAGMMGLRRVMKEEDLSLAPKRARLARVADPPGEGKLAEVRRSITEIPGSTLPRAVIFGFVHVPLVHFVGTFQPRRVSLAERLRRADDRAGTLTSWLNRRAPPLRLHSLTRIGARSINLKSEV